MAGWIEKIWFDRHPLGYLGAPLLWPLSKLFAVIAYLRRRYFIVSPHLSYRAPIPVVVVGNITAGGNGKTPLVIWLVEKLKEKGFTPAVISRGYGGKSKVYPVIVNEDSTPDEVGDEPVLIYQRTQCLVAVSPVRKDSINALLPLGADIIISDDGLQHYQMARDLEFVVVDGKRRFGNENSIPMGPLRENLTRLKCVDRIICNGEKAKKNELSMKLIPHHFVNVMTGEKCLPERFSFTSCVAMAGIGNPARFFTTLKKLGITASAYYPFMDHQRFELKKLLSLTSSSQSLLMTEKDAVKCRYLIKENQEILNWWYLPVDAHFSDAAATDLLTLITTLRKK